MFPRAPVALIVIFTGSMAVGLSAGVAGFRNLPVLVFMVAASAVCGAVTYVFGWQDGRHIGSREDHLVHEHRAEVDPQQQRQRENHGENHGDQ